MPDLEVTIGGRGFSVACQEGEEQYLRVAARILDKEAMAINEQMGRVTETRMLLMAGLMLGDRLAGLEEKFRLLEEKLQTREKLIAELREATPPQAGQGDAAAVPAHVTDSLSATTARAEALADAVAERARES